MAIIGKPSELSGFSVAGALSLVFLNLESFSEFSGSGFSAKTKERLDRIDHDIEPIKSKETEPEETAESYIDKGLYLYERSLKVLTSLTNSEYSWRTITGLVKEMNLSKSEVADMLHELKEKELENASKPSSGKPIWGATMRGYISREI